MKKMIILLVVISFFSITFAQYHYQPAKTVDSSDTNFGVTYHDPYRWLEKLGLPEVDNWFKQQAAYTDSILNKLNGRGSLIGEWKKPDKPEPALITGFAYGNGRVFYRKSIPGEKVAALQNAAVSGKPVLMKVNYDSGHFTEDKNVTYADPAGQLAFVLWECGNPDYQPKK